jgi:5,10-methylene-tetrahydrofolate dehydrogenase/methenyl tetrahydrofolate cyclohydrolase
MTAKIIDGKAIADDLRKDIAKGVEELLAAGGHRPGLATVLVGENPASQTYVRMKQKACAEVGIESFGHTAEVGIESFGHTLPDDASQEEVETLVKQLNDDPTVHGILVQLPLPAGLDEEAILRAISIEKDVDGFHPINMGRLAQKGREPLFVPCTPAGCIVLLKKAGAKLEGANAVVVGRSNIVACLPPYSLSRKMPPSQFVIPAPKTCRQYVGKQTCSSPPSAGLR